MNKADQPCFYYLRWLGRGLFIYRLDDGHGVILVHASEHLAHRHMKAVVLAKSLDDPPVAVVTASVSAGQLVMHLNRLLAQSRDSRQVYIAFPDDRLYLELLNKLLAPDLLPPNDR